LGSYDPRNKIVVNHVWGKRIQEPCDRLVEGVKKRTDENIPFFTSDEHEQYRTALLKAYGSLEEIKPTGKAGRPKKPRLLPPPDLKYAQVVKYRRKGRVVKIRTKVIFGTEDEIQELLEKSPVSNHINVAFVESNNLTLRERNRRLTGCKRMGCPEYGFLE